MRPALEQRLATWWPPKQWRDVHVLVAVSGGPDSVALLRALDALRQAENGPGRLIVAHYNHGWRGAESEADESGVRGLANKLGLEVETRQASGAAPRTEAAAREARLAFFSEAAGLRGARYVALAHTADDRVETVLHRIIRGSGLHGLAGIARVRRLGPATLIRPLLKARRSELVAYLDEIGQEYRTDSSNFDLRYTRNRLRGELLPLLAEKYNPRVVDALLRLSDQAYDLQEIVRPLVEALADRGVRHGPGDVLVFERAAFAGQPAALVRDVVRQAWRLQGWPEQAMGDDEWRELASRILSPAPIRAAARHMFPGGIRAEANDTGLRLEKPSAMRHGAV